MSSSSSAATRQIATVTIHEICDRGTRLFCQGVPPRKQSDPAKTAPARLVEMSADVQAAVLLDPAGGLIAASDEDAERSRHLADLAHELVLAADAAAPRPTEQIEVQVASGAVFAVRSARHTLACVVRRLALPALILYDLGQTLRELEAGA